MAEVEMAELDKEAMEASEASAESSEKITELENMVNEEISNQGVASKEIVEELNDEKAKKEESNKEVFKGIGEKLGIEGDISSDTMQDRGVNGEKLRNAIEKGVEKGVKKAVEKMQEKNGESGKSIEDSPKTKREIFSKWGKRGLALILALTAVSGFGAYWLHRMARGMTGCYKVDTKEGTMEKIHCAAVQSAKKCNCAKANTIDFRHCGVTPDTCSGTIRYVWQEYSADDVLASLPHIISKAGGELLTGLKDLPKNLVTWLLYISAAFLIMVMLYFVGKYLVSRVSKEEESLEED